MHDDFDFLDQHCDVTRRYFIKLGAGGAAAGLASWAIADEPAKPNIAAAFGKKAPEKPPRSIKSVDTLLTPQRKFFDVSRGKPLPHSLPEEKLREVGLTRETWRLEVIADADNPPGLRNPLSKEKGNALDFDALLRLADKHAVRFAKIMTCLNLGCPLGFGIWEGVPLREVVALVEPRDKLRRVFYHGYHNDDPKQIFRSSLPIGRVLEDYFDLPPVILCYKLNGEWLTPERGGPVRMVVPEHYGFKSVKWLTHVVLTNLPHANDTYAEQGNDVDSPMKTFAATLTLPEELKAGEPIAVTGYAQVGIGGLSKVQAWLARDGEPSIAGDRHHASAPWVDMEILPPPTNWGGDLPEGKLPLPVEGFDDAGRPRAWPLRLAMVHWAGVLPAVPAGDYTLRCRTIDANGFAQPLPRPLRNSGHVAVEQKSVRVG